ncbi:MAG: hypothetical protein H7Z71_05600 [Moraxellaceae bacterium]|nr:hypothetical protein [Pseudobdellovibrionaceae bacterium]
MNTFPEKPFLTTDFSDKGGGVDFLGLRLVNLGILSDELLPGLNNQTRDAGSFCVGAWIPWKFTQLWKNAEFNISNFNLFRQYIEIIFSSHMTDGSDTHALFGKPKNRIGNGQKVKFPCPVSFEKVKRTEATSIYAAPLYGPALKYMELLQKFPAAAIDGSSTGIPLTSEDDDTKKLMTALEKHLIESRFYKKLKISKDHKINEDEAADLGNHGLCASSFLSFDLATKKSFLKKLLPTEANDSGFKRRLTAKLIISTIEQVGPIDGWDLRMIWYTGLMTNGKKLNLSDELEKHRKIWAVFMARQYQRYFLEKLLVFFEQSLIEGCHSIEEVSLRAIDELTKCNISTQSFAELLNIECGKLTKNKTIDLSETSKLWNNTVHFQHKFFEYLEVDESEDANNSARAISLLIGWYLRVKSWGIDEIKVPFLKYGDSDRVSISWFIGWIDKRSTLDLKQLLNELFQELIFSQHIRIALSRFDGESQKIRFILDDKGIVPTKGTTDIGTREVPWMADRLDAFIDLLCDVDVISKSDDLIKLKNVINI